MTYVHYWYRARGSSEDLEISTERWPDKTPQDVMPLLGAVDSVIKVRPDGPQEHEEGPNEYRILEYQQVAVEWGDHLRTVANMLIVVVTDP